MQGFAVGVGMDGLKSTSTFRRLNQTHHKGCLGSRLRSSSQCVHAAGAFRSRSPTPEGPKPYSHHGKRSCCCAPVHPFSCNCWLSFLQRPRRKPRSYLRPLQTKIIMEPSTVALRCCSDRRTDKNWLRTQALKSGGLS